MWGRRGPRGPPYRWLAPSPLLRTNPAFLAPPPPAGSGRSPWTTRGEVTGCLPGPACPIRKPRLSSLAEVLTEARGTMLRGRGRVQVFARLLT